MPAPTDLDNFKSICKADQKKRAYCCRIDEVCLKREYVVLRVMLIHAGGNHLCLRVSQATSVLNC